MKKSLYRILLVILGTFCLSFIINSTMTYAQRSFQLSCNKVFKTSEKVQVQYFDYNYNRNRNNKDQVAPKLQMALYRLEDSKVLFEGLNPQNQQLWAKDEVLKEAQLIKTWAKDDIRNQRNYYRNTIDIDPLEEGFYVLEVVRDDYFSQVPIFVSNYGIVTRTMGNEIVSYVYDKKTGNVVDDYAFCMLNNSEQVDALEYKNGVAYFKVDGRQDGYLPIIAEKNGKIVASQTYLNWYYYQQNNALKAYVFSDRSAYRPGQTVNFKGIFRKIDGFEHQVITDDTITCIIRDPKYGEVLKQDFILDKDGTFSASLELEEEAKLGQYTITWQLKGNAQRRYYNYGNGQYTFKVEEYKKPEYEVLVNLDKPQYTKGDKIKVDIEARYFFGAPVTNATVQYKVLREEYYVPWYYRLRCYWWYEPYYTNTNNQEVVESGTAEIDESGKFSISYRTDNTNETNHRYTIIAEVTDASRRVITGSASAIVAHTEFTLTAQSERYYYHPNEKIKIRVGASDYSKNPVSTEFTAYLKGGRKYHHYDNSKGKEKPTIEKVKGITDIETGETFIEFDAPKTGHYTVEVEAKDKRGNTTRTKTYAYVLKKDDAYYRWWSRDAGQIQILTDKKVYDAGDELNAMIYLPNEADALITVNGQALEYYDALHFEAKKMRKDDNEEETKAAFKELTIPINEKAYGSMKVYVCYVKDERFYQREEIITIIPKNRFLEVALVFDEDEYKPRTTATAIVEVTDENGKPVSNVNVTLSTADESIYFLYPDKTPDIRKAFFDQRNSYQRTEMGNFSSHNQARQMMPEALLWRKDKMNLTLDRKAFLPNGEWYKIQYLDKETYQIEEEKSVLSGFVIDNETGKPLKDVTIKIGNNTFKTNEDGFYAIKGFIEGYTTLDFEQNGYKTTTKNIQFVEGQDILLNVGMGDKDKTIEVVTPFEGMDFMDMDAAGGAVLEDVAVTSAPRVMAKSAMGATGAVGAAYSMDGMELERGIGNEAKPMKRKRKRIAPGKTVEPMVRTKFEDAIYWNPSVTTNSKGEATVQIQLPDNLTTWRTTAKVITPTTQVGQTQAKVVVKKNLLVRMETPRFINIGDNLVIATNIHNYLDSEKQVKVQLMADGLALKNTEKDIVVAANGEQRIDWEVDAKWITDAKLTVKALTDEESDAMELEVPVQPYGLEILEAESVALQDKDAQTLEIEIPNDIDLATASLEVSAAPSVTSALLSSMDQLIGYPYGCVEQTMSRFLPTVVVANTLENLGQNYQTTISKDELQKMVAQGYKRLGQLQQSDGGWGWWRNDGSHPFMTAYVMNGLHLSKKAGFAIDERVYQKALNAFRRQVQKGATDKGDSETTLAYQMMVAMNIGLTDLWNPDLPRGSEGSYAQALWLQAAVLAEDDFVIKEMLKRLEESAIREGTSTYWGGKKFYYRWQDDRVETTANAIKAISMVDPKHKDIANSVQWLLKQRKGNSWHNTRQTAMTIYGLQEVIKQEVNPNMELELYVNGNLVDKRKVTNENVFEKATAYNLTGERYYASTDNKIDLEKYDVLKNGINKVEIRQTGNGTHYINTKLVYFAAGEQLEKYEEKKPVFEVERQYFKLVEKQSDKGLVYEKKPIDKKSIKSGDNIFVTVIVKSDKLQEYVLIEDPIPAGCEFIKNTDGYIIEGEAQYGGSVNKNVRGRRGRRYSSYWSHWYTHREYRDEHLALTVTRFNKGEYNYSYLMKAQIPGQYQVKPTLVQLMYYPENRGYSDFSAVEIK